MEIEKWIFKRFYDDKMGNKQALRLYLF